MNTPNSGDVITCVQGGGTQSSGFSNSAADNVTVDIQTGAAVQPLFTVPAVNLGTAATVNVAGGGANLISKGTAINAGNSLAVLLLDGGTIQSTTGNDTIVGGAGSHVTVGGALTFGSFPGGGIPAVVAPLSANSIKLTGGGNRVTILPGNPTFSIAGFVIGGTAPNNVLELSGPINTTFNVADIGAADTLPQPQYTGFDSYEKTGTSTITLTGTTPVALPFTLLGGTLAISSDANLGATASLTFGGGTLETTADITSARPVTLNAGGGTLNTDAGTTLTLTGTIGGTGGLAKIGGGTLNLLAGGTNTYSGGTTITTGTVIGSAVSFGTGPVVDNATLIINQAADANFANPISGTGTLTKQGAGRLNLTGASPFTGPTTVAAGTLAVNGSLSGSVVTVNSGATLGGNGTVGGIAALSGSTIAPGNSIGQLNVNGNVSFVAGSTYAVEINAAGAGDKIVATGTATLTGGTVNATAAAGVYSPATRYTILTAAGGVTGKFTNLVTTANLAFLNPALGYDPNNVFIFFTQNAVGFPTIGQTRNQIAAGGGIQGLAAGPLYSAVLSSTVANALRAFDVSSGEIHASATTAQFITADIIRNAILDRLRGGFGTGVGYGPDPRFGPLPGTPSVPAAYSADLPGRRGTAPVPMTILDPQVFALWGLGFGSFGSTRTDGNAATLTRDTGGFLLAADITIDGMYRFGLGGGYTNTNLDVVNRLSRGSIESGYGTIYFGATLGAFTARLGAEYAGNSLDLRRNVVFPGFADNERGRYGSSTKQVFGEFAYRFGFGPGFLEPIVGASGVWLDRDRFTEAGGPAALFAPARGQSLGTATVGVRGEYALGDTSPFSLRGLLAYRRAYGDVVPTALLGFTAGTGQTFTIAGIPIDRNAFVAEAGVDWRVADGITVGLLYMGQVGPRAQDHGLKGDFVWKF